MLILLINHTYFIFKALNNLFYSQVVNAQVTPELASVASSTVLMLLVDLRSCYIGSKTSGSDSSQLSFNQSAQLNISQLLTLNGPQTATIPSPSTNTLSLKYILRNIIEWIILSGLSSQRLRINLYASLLNFMNIVKGHSHESSGGDEYSDMFVSRLDKTMIRSNALENANSGDQVEMTIEVLSSYGDKLVDILCHDCIGGHDVCKMLALSCIDMLLDLDPMANFIQFIARRGYLSNLIDSLLKIDQDLCRILDSKPETLKALYVYESKMAMLSRVAGSHVGAELLLEHKVLSILATMKVYDLHPDFHVSNFNMTQESNAFVPPVDTRYQQILSPALNLCDVILTTLGTENYSATTQIIYFLLSHVDMIEIVLRAGTPLLNVGLLQELSAITGIIARVANQDLTTLHDPHLNQDLGAHLFRLQKLMLTLFPRFIITEKLRKEIHQAEARKEHESGEKQKQSRLIFILQIASNIALYARNSISNHSADHRSVNVLFSPNISDDLPR